MTSRIHRILELPSITLRLLLSFKSADGDDRIFFSHHLHASCQIASTRVRCKDHKRTGLTVPANFCKPRLGPTQSWDIVAVQMGSGFVTARREDSYANTVYDDSGAIWPYDSETRTKLVGRTISETP